MIWKLLKSYMFSILLTFIIVACGDNSSNATEESEKTTNRIISGVAQIGPFEKGSIVTVYELDDDLQTTGTNYEAEIENDWSEYSVNTEKIKSPYALIKAEGYYRNNITGDRAKDKATLYALTELRNNKKANINILTHLSHKRAIYLATQNNMPVAKAKKQAEKEVLKSFGIDEDFDNAENMGIIGKDNQSMALFVISTMMQTDIADESINERLTNYAKDIEKDGVWDNQDFITHVADWAYSIYYYSTFGAIKDAVVKWNKSVVFSIFEKHVNNFWHLHYGLGVCTDDRKNEVLKNELRTSYYNDKYFICRPGGKWKEASEQEIKKFFKPSGETKDDDLNKGAIQPTILELDTLKWNDTTNGAIRKGNETNIIYIFDEDTWRVANLPEASLGGCSLTSLDSAGYVDNRTGQIKNNSLTNSVYTSGYYKCEYSNAPPHNTLYFWSHVDRCSLDTYDSKNGKLIKWKNGKEGETRWGNLWKDGREELSKISSTCPKKCYVFKNKSWASTAITDCMGLGECTTKRIGTIKQGPAIHSEKYCSVSDTNKHYQICNNILADVDTLKKEKYICLSPNNYKHEYGKKDGFNYDYDPTPIIGGWTIISKADTSQFPYIKNGILLPGEKDPKTLYVYDLQGLREADEEEINLGQGCSYYTRGKKTLQNGTKSYFSCDLVADGENPLHYWIYDNEKNIGQMTDPRDKSVYKTVNLGLKTWMAENLNYTDSINYPSMSERNKCEEDKPENCKNHGRLYTWSAIIDSVYWSSKGKTCGNTPKGNNKCDLPDVVQGICPKGWHVPSIQDWEDMGAWMNSFKYSVSYESCEFLPSIYKEHFFWTSSDSTEATSYSSYIDLYEPEPSGNIRYSTTKTKDTPLAVRCVKDD